MKLSPVTCENCGAPLRIRPDARFVTCTHCDTQLQVERTEGTLSTVVLEAKVDEIADEVGELRDEAKLARLERQWDLDRENLMITIKGARVVPLESNGTTGVYSGIVAGLFLVGLGVYTTELPLRAGGTIATMCVVGGVVIAAVGISSGNRIIRKARAYSAAEAKYRKRRARLLARTRGEHPPHG